MACLTQRWTQAVIISYPICSMYGIFTYTWVIFRANVGKYSIYGAYGYCFRCCEKSEILKWWRFSLLLALLFRASQKLYITLYHYNRLYLVGGLEHEFYFSIYWESSQLTKSYFSEGRYTTNQICLLSTMVDVMRAISFDKVGGSPYLAKLLCNWADYGLF